MQEDNLRALIDDVRRQKTEKQTLELKAAHGGFPGKIYDTLSSFSNQDDGGVLLFGVTDKHLNTFVSCINQPFLLVSSFKSTIPFPFDNTI